jgi:hypothetical protein
MNPNDLYAQQMAVLNQAAQKVQHLNVEIMAFGLVFFILQCWVIYMFYARLRDVGDELRKFRIAYEFASLREVKARSSSQTPSTPSHSVAQTGKPTDAKYMPKS